MTILNMPPLNTCSTLARKPRVSRRSSASMPLARRESVVRSWMGAVEGNPPEWIPFLAWRADSSAATKESKCADRSSAFSFPLRMTCASPSLTSTAATFFTREPFPTSTVPNLRFWESPVPAFLISRSYSMETDTVLPITRDRSASLASTDHGSSGLPALRLPSRGARRLDRETRSSFSPPLPSGTHTKMVSPLWTSTTRASNLLLPVTVGGVHPRQIRNCWRFAVASACRMAVAASVPVKPMDQSATRPKPFLSSSTEMLPFGWSIVPTRLP
mmetsp:Transcript_19369/g.73232  ORF Transcript_19369/g.73232 Transcript_19369/m.73232 type:complete len:273 (+) Transcript_19369:1514-2332(+)